MQNHIGTLSTLYHTWILSREVPQSQFTHLNTLVFHEFIQFIILGFYQQRYIIKHMLLNEFIRTSVQQIATTLSYITSQKKYHTFISLS